MGRPRKEKPEEVETEVGTKGTDVEAEKSHVVDAQKAKKEKWVAVQAGMVRKGMVRKGLRRIGRHGTYKKFMEAV